MIRPKYPEMTWPKYPKTTKQAISVKHLRYLVSDKETLIALGNIVVCIAAYLIGTNFSLPLSHPEKISHVIEQSPFLVAINELLTGGALGKIAPFALGVLPLFFFHGGVTSTANIRQRLSPLTPLIGQILQPRALFATTIVAILLTSWYTLNGAIVGTISSFVLTTLYLVVGTCLLFVIESKLLYYGGPNIISLNAVLIGINYIRTLLLTRHINDLVIVLLIVIFIYCLMWLMRKVDSIELVNIREEHIKEGTLPIPVTNELLQLTLLVFTFLCLAVITILLNIFTNLRLSPFGSSLPDVVLLICVQAMISALFIGNQFIDNLLSQFNSTATARRLRVNYWIAIDKDKTDKEKKVEVKAGDDTAKFLTRRAVKNHRLTYIFYLISVILFSLVGLVAQAVHVPITPLPFGPLGFVIILTLCAEIGYSLIDTTHRYIQKVDLGDFWTLPGATTANLQAFMEPATISDLLQNAFPTINSEDQETITRAFGLSAETGNENQLKDALSTITIIQKAHKEQLESSPGIHWGNVLLQLLMCTFVTSTIISVGAWVFLRFYPQAASDLGFREAVAFGWLALFGGLLFAPLTGVYYSIKASFRRHRI